MLSTQNSDLEKLLKMGLVEDVQQQAALEILSGKPLAVALRHARAEVARQNRPCGFVRLDDEGDEALALHERLAAPAGAGVARWRAGRPDTVQEALCAQLARGTRELAVLWGVSQRRAQQKVKEIVDRAARGQGDLFGEGGEA